MKEKNLSFKLIIGLLIICLIPIFTLTSCGESEEDRGLVFNGDKTKQEQTTKEEGKTNDDAPLLIVNAEEPLTIEQYKAVGDGSPIYNFVKTMVVKNPLILNMKNIEFSLTVYDENDNILKQDSSSIWDINLKMDKTVNMDINVRIDDTEIANKVSYITVDKVEYTYTVGEGENVTTGTEEFIYPEPIKMTVKR